MAIQFPFETKSKKDWLEKVAADLKGRSLSELDWTVTQNISISPFAHSDDFPIPNKTLSVSSDNEWYISEECIVDDEKQSNAKAVKALESGATALSFIIKNEACNFNTLLKDIQLEWIFTHLEGTAVVIQKFIDFINESTFDKSKIDLSYSVTDQANIDSTQNFPEQTKNHLCSIENSNLIEADEEIATLINQANNFIQSSTNRYRTAQQVFFDIRLSDSFYINVCKIRALKILWNLLIASYELKPISPFVKAGMASETFGLDADDTKIKAAAQAMSAAIAGACLIHIPPAQKGENENFHRRIARNASHLLHLESFLGRVTDPVAGSYYFEKLTDEIGQSAWSKFQQKTEQA